MKFEQAKLELYQQELRSALHLFSEALKACPSSERKGLGKIIFYTGMTFKKLGMDICALETWKKAYTIDKGSPSVKMYKRYANQYGMPKQCSRDDDDYQAFIAIQQKKYLMTKNSGRFSTDAEKDMVRELIREKWLSMKKTISFADMKCGQKIDLFQTTEIYFPLIRLSENDFFSFDL